MKTHFVFILFALTLQYTVGQTQKDSLPGDTSLVTSDKELQTLSDQEKGNFTYKVEDYFQKPKQTTFKFSPDGMFFSYREKDSNGKLHIYVKNTETGVVKRIIEEKEELIRGYGWANNKRLIYVMDQGGNENYHLFAVDLDGNNQKDLTPYKDVTVSILEILKEQPEFLVVSMNKDNAQIFEPYKININTGKIEKLFEN